jgi:class 3 adenylate cyclase
MTFDEVLDQVRELLQQRGRVTYRSLKRRFDLDDEYVEDLKGELIRAEGVAADEDGDVLVWMWSTTVASSQLSMPGSSQPPAPQTPDSQPQPLAANSSGERRQLTVMFIDLVGSTTLSQQLDPEDYHARVGSLSVGLPAGRCPLRGAYCPVLGRWRAGVLWVSDRA